jgi:hypothetical protein
MPQEIKMKNSPGFQSIPPNQMIMVQALILIKSFMNMFASAAECLRSGQQMDR